MGRPRKLTAEQEAEVWNRYESGQKISVIARDMNLSYMVVYASIQREKKYASELDGSKLNAGQDTESTNA